MISLEKKRGFISHFCNSFATLYKMNGMEQPRLQKFLDLFRTVSYAKGQVLLFQGEAPRGAFIIKHGIVKVYNLDSAGREQLIYFQAESEIFPFTWVMGKAPSAFYFYEAFTDCEVYLVPRERYLDFIKSDKELLIRTLEMQAVREAVQTMRLNALIHSKAAEKLVHTLHYLVQSHGEYVSKDVMVLKLPLTQQDFANLTGITRETTAVEFGKLKKRGVISYKTPTVYHINMTKFQKLLADQFIVDANFTL